MPESNRDKTSRLLDEGSIEDIFSDYLEKIYNLSTEDEKREALVIALRDAFFAGMSVGIISENQHHISELLLYASRVAQYQTIIKQVGEGWVN